jgi:hypothetical protein
MRLARPARGPHAGPAVRRVLAIVAVLVVAIAVAAAVFAAPGPGVAGTPAPACAQALVVGLRGNGDTLDHDDGMGGDAATVARRLRDRLSGRLGVTLVGYPYTTGPWWRVGGHVRSAAAALTRYLDERRRTCPAERLALIGQSEGAAVVHLALPSAGPQLAVAVLLADPLRVARSVYDAAPDAPDDGVLAHLLLGAWAGAGPVRDVVPPALTARVRSYCLTEDPVCDPGAGDLWRRVEGGVDVHTTYRLDPEGIADRAADFAAATLLRPNPAG